MGTRRHRIWILAVGLLAAGGLRLPVEARWSAEWRTAGLLRPGIETGTRAKLGQTFCAVAMGGLRTLVATFYNFRAFGYYEDREWDKNFATYQTMVALAPRTGEYWIAGAHHQAMNAASYYRNDEVLEMSPVERGAKFREMVLRGRAFAERGARQVPDNWRIHGFLGLLLTDPHKFRVFGDPEVTFERAAQAYRAAADCPDSLPYLRRFEMYSLARVKARRGEALALARQLYANPGNRTPTMRHVYFALEAGAHPGVIDSMALAVSVFGSAEVAYRELSGYWLRGRANFPMDGVALTLRQLELKLKVPEERSVLNRTAPLRGEELEGRDDE